MRGAKVASLWERTDKETGHCVVCYNEDIVPVTTSYSNILEDTALEYGNESVKVSMKVPKVVGKKAGNLCKRCISNFLQDLVKHLRGIV